MNYIIVIKTFIVENGLGAIDKVDENFYVADDYRIDYLRRHEAMASLVAASI